MAFRHSCPHAGISGSPRCPRNQSGKGPKRCPGCHASLEVEEGRYGVFAWDPANRAYRESDARRICQREANAQTWADKLSEADAFNARVNGCDRSAPGGFVVRFIRDRVVPNPS